MSLTGVKDTKHSSCLESVVQIYNDVIIVAVIVLGGNGSSSSGGNGVSRSVDDDDHHQHDKIETVFHDIYCIATFMYIIALSINTHCNAFP